MSPPTPGKQVTGHEARAVLSTARRIAIWDQMYAGSANLPKDKWCTREELIKASFEQHGIKITVDELTEVIRGKKYKKSLGLDSKKVNGEWFYRFTAPTAAPSPKTRSPAKKRSASGSKTSHPPAHATAAAAARPSSAPKTPASTPPKAKPRPAAPKRRTPLRPTAKKLSSPSKTPRKPAKSPRNRASSKAAASSTSRKRSSSEISSPAKADSVQTSLQSHSSKKARPSDGSNAKKMAMRSAASSGATPSRAGITLVEGIGGGDGAGQADAHGAGGDGEEKGWSCTLM